MWEQLQGLGLCRLLSNPCLKAPPPPPSQQLAQVCTPLPAASFRNKCLFQMLAAFSCGLDGNDKK